MKYLINKTMCVLLMSLFSIIGINAQTKSSSSLKVNYESLVSRADLTYNTPVVRSEEGLPIGNGRMGTLVWTTPNAIHYQINRVDVFAMGKNTNNFKDGHTNYSNGLGYIDINTVDYGDEVFTGSAFEQHLSVYEGLTTVNGNGLKARVLAWTDGDVIATEIDDQRVNPSAINIDLRMLRYAINYIDGKNWELTSNHAIQIKQGEHTATSRFEIKDGKIILIQEFKEGDYYNASAVAIGIVDRESKAVYYNESTVRLTAKPGKGIFTILTSSASSFDPKEDIAQLALKQLEAAQLKRFNGLLQDSRAWWGQYWPKAFVRLHSADNAADEVEKNFTYYLYAMASCSRGEYMPGFRGMLWYTNGDLAMWGSQYWWNNQGTYFNGLTPVNRPELLEPVYKTFMRHYDSYATAAKQQWGSKGIWIPETTWFNGLEVLPDSIADEMRDLYLAKKKWEDRSKSFSDFAESKNDLNSRWNWLFLRRSSKSGETGGGPFAWVTHIMSSTAKIAYVYWLNYAYYLDKDWLKETGYPIIKGIVEFYSNFPNLYKEADGKYHLHYVNNLESSWGGKDTPEELMAMRAMIPIAIRASQILGVDADRRPVWKEILDNLTPLPNSAISAEYYDYINIGTKDSPLFNIALEAYRRRNSKVDENTTVHVLSRAPVAAAHFGLADDVKYMIPKQIISTRQDNCDIVGSGESGLGVLRNRLMLREGPGAIECERLGLAAQAVCTALLQSVPPAPDKEPVNYIFPAWPKEWDAQFTLAARNAFVISASMVKGKVEFVEIQSNKGGQCLIQNPWGEDELTVYRNGKKSKNISGKLLTLPSKSGELITLVPKGENLPSKEIL
ncbi:MAG: DUF5703 domain-containing protein [Tannerella sp.]|jgi:hypothetical protein|nr:DUF5703 domain-containing protein [Tannerella sp.]